jgi:hypothetical protein
MTEEQNLPLAESRWPKHIAKRSKLGWCAAVFYWTFFVLGTFGLILSYISPSGDTTQDPPLTLTFLVITLVVLFLMFYVPYKLMMWRIYYAPKETLNTLNNAKSFFDLFT